MAKGFMGDGKPLVLFVHLTDGSMNEEQIDEVTSRRFVGGYGLGAKLLFDRQRAEVDALGPENHIGFFSGTCNGTPALVASRYMVVGKSPKTLNWIKGWRTKEQTLEDEPTEGVTITKNPLLDKHEGKSDGYFMILKLRERGQKKDE